MTPEQMAHFQELGRQHREEFELEERMKIAIPPRNYQRSKEKFQEQQLQEAENKSKEELYQEFLRMEELWYESEEAHSLKQL